jgi:hypothetical protein
VNTLRYSPVTCETPGLRRPGVFCAFAESDLLTVRESNRNRKVGRSRGHNGVTFAHEGHYSNQPPDKVVKLM